MNKSHNLTFAYLLNASVWIYFLGNIGGWVIPEIVFNLMGERSLSESAAGGIVALELLGVALGSLALSLSVDRIPLRLIGTLTAAILVISQYISQDITTPATLLAVRFVCGFAQGVLMGIANAVLASGPNPHSRLAVANIANVALGSLLLYALAPLQTLWDGIGLFEALTLVCLVLAPLCLRIKPRLVSTEQAIPQKLGLPNASSYWLVIAMAVFAAGSGAAFTFSFLMGSNAGLADSSINTTISIAVLGAIPGSLLCGLLGNRFRVFWPFTIGLAIHALASVAAANSTGLWSFALGVAGILFGAYFFLPYLQGLSTRYDPLGGTSAAIGGAFFLTMAAGAYIGGTLIEFAGLASLGWAVVIGNLISGLLIMVAVAVYREPEEAYHLAFAKD